MRTRLNVVDRGHFHIVFVRRQMHIAVVQRHWAIMQVRSPLDLGLVIRDRRRKLKLSQTELARKAGVGRQWVVAMEQGKPRAELRLVLRTLSVLDLRLMIDPGDRLPPSSNDMSPLDINAVVNAARLDRK